jgi:hypothetical protein
MNQQKHKNRSRATLHRKLRPIRFLKWFAAAMGLLIVIAFVTGVWLHFGDSSQRGTARANFEKLVGDWERPDGDYMIRISGIHPDGAIQAAYFNPNPIHIAQAHISLQNDAVTLFVELQDAGYPGSKYDLVYNPNEDILQGTYFQAQIQELYNVVFLRKK